MRSIGTGQSDDVSKVNQKQEGHMEPRGLADYYFFFYEHIDSVFRTMRIAMWHMCVLLY